MYKIMSVQVPKEMNYAEPMASLPPSTRTIRMVVAPSNVSTASGSQQIIFDLPDSNTGYIVPGTLKLNYTANVVASGAGGHIRGVPAYTFFARSDVYTQQGAQLIEGINQYGALANVLYATKLTMSAKLGMAYSLGLLDTGITAPTNSNLTGRVLSVANETWTMSAPLGNIISNCEKLVPARCGFRLILTTDQLANIANPPTGGSLTSFTLSNLELAYDMVEFSSPEMEAVVQGLSNEGQITLKSQSYSLSSQNLPSGSNGTQTLTFNTRLSSIKSLVALFGGSGANQVNGSYYDSVDITNDVAGAGGGSYAFEIAGNQYPEKPLSSKNNKASIHSALADCWGGNASNLYNESMSILPLEYSIREDGTTTNASPGRFYVGQNVEKLQTSAMLTGVSSNNSAINLRIDLPVATSLSHQVSLICLYDSILTIDLNSKQASVRV